MIVKRTRHKSNYTVIDNIMVDDDRLSWKARGLMLYILRMPDDWKFYFKDLQNRSAQDGETSLRSGLDELKKFGYLEVVRERDSEGRLGESVWIVDEDPPILGSHVLGNHDLLSTKDTKYSVKNSVSSSKKQSGEAPYWGVTEKDRPMAAMYNEVIEGIVQDSGVSPEDMPQTLREWIRYVANGSNPPARLATFVEHLYGRDKVPSFPRLGALLKRHEAQHVVEALWKAAPQLPEKPVNYAEKILSNWDEEDEANE